MPSNKTNSAANPGRVCITLSFRSGVLLTLAMVATLLLVIVGANPAQAQETATVRVSNMDQPIAGAENPVLWSDARTGLLHQQRPRYPGQGPYVHQVLSQTSELARLCGNSGALGGHTLRRIEASRSGAAYPDQPLLHRRNL